MSLATVHANMRAAFRQKLRDMTDLPTIAWEGRLYKPFVGTPFMRESFRPISSDLRAIGPNGLIAHRMTGNLSLFYPIAKGTVEIETMAGLLLTRFKPGTSLEYGSDKGLVLQAQRAPLLQEADWMSCPVTISLVAYTAN
jgi:hypothetical protein